MTGRAASRHWSMRWVSGQALVNTCHGGNGAPMSSANGKQQTRSSVELSECPCWCSKLACNIPGQICSIKDAGHVSCSAGSRKGSALTCKSYICKLPGPGHLAHRLPGFNAGSCEIQPAIESSSCCSVEECTPRLVHSGLLLPVMDALLCELQPGIERRPGCSVLEGAPRPVGNLLEPNAVPELVHIIQPAVEGCSGSPVGDRPSHQVCRALQPLLVPGMMPPGCKGLQHISRLQPMHAGNVQPIWSLQTFPGQIAVLVTQMSILCTVWCRQSMRAVYDPQCLHLQRRGSSRHAGRQVARTLARVRCMKRAAICSRRARCTTAWPAARRQALKVQRRRDWVKYSRARVRAMALPCMRPRPVRHSRITWPKTCSTPCQLSPAALQHLSAVMMFACMENEHSPFHGGYDSQIYVASQAELQCPQCPLCAANMPVHVGIRLPPECSASCAYEPMPTCARCSMPPAAACSASLSEPPAHPRPHEMMCITWDGSDCCPALICILLHVPWCAYEDSS